MGIIVTRAGANAKLVEPSSIEKEGRLQEYVARNPEVLPVSQLKEGTRLLVVGREFPTRSGPIDVLAVDGEGDLYVIETKRYKNPDKRQVVAQMLDYGASLWREYGNTSGFAEAVDEFLAGKAGGCATLAGALSKTYGMTENDAAHIVETIEQKLSDGDIRFVVLMDHLNDELKDLIQFVNAKSNFAIYAVELEFYEYEGIEIVIPRIYGDEVNKPPRPKSQRTSQQNEAVVIATLNSSAGPEAVAALRWIVDQAPAHDVRPRWGKDSLGLLYVDPSGNVFHLGRINATKKNVLLYLHGMCEEHRLPEAIADDYVDEVKLLVYGPKGSDMDGGELPFPELAAKKEQWYVAIDRVIERIRDAMAKRTQKTERDSIRAD